MTDPVDTDALRTPYDHFPELREAYSQGFERAYAEVDRLRALIIELPHEYPQCTVGYIDGVDELPCFCIKRKAGVL